jgi:hypothetical protein
MDGAHKSDLARRTASRAVACGFLALLLTSTRVALGWSVAVTCTDGGSTAVLSSRGHSAEFAGVCDLDATVDEVCTFYSDQIVLKCAIDSGPGCQDISEDSYPPPCPIAATVAVRLRPHRRVTREISIFRPSNPRYAPERVVFRCIRGQHQTPTTTTTLPGVSYVTGDWVFEVHSLTSDCPGALAAVVGTPMLIEQEGTVLHGCRMGYLEFQGAASQGGFAFDPRGSFSIQPAGRPLYDLVSTIQGRVTSGGTFDVSEELDGRVSGVTGSSCKVLWEGAMLPRIGHPCGDHSNCIRLEGPCSRCQDGFCRVPPPFCRAGPSEPTRLKSGGVDRYTGTAAWR